MEDIAGGSQVTLAATSTAIMGNRSGRRLAFSITNYSALVAYINMSNTQSAALNTGIPLYPGATISDSSSDVYKCWQGTITGIEATGAATISIWERVQM